MTIARLPREARKIVWIRVTFTPNILNNNNRFTEFINRLISETKNATKTIFLFFLIKFHPFAICMNLFMSLFSLFLNSGENKIKYKLGIRKARKISKMIPEKIPEVK